MKTWKKITGLMLTFCMVAAVLIVPDMNASAKAKISAKNVSIETQSVSYNPIEITYSKGDAQIKNIKTTSKNLVAKQTYQYYHKDAYKYSEQPYGYAQIGLYASKSGKYKVTFDVCNKAGKKISHHTVNVTASGGTYVSPIKKATFAGKLISYDLTNKKSGKFKVTMNKGYKLKSIQMVTYDKANNNQRVYKNIKNNANVKLGKYAYKNEWENTYGSNDSWSYNLNTDLFAETQFIVTYQDTKTKATGTRVYSVYRTAEN